MPDVYGPFDASSFGQASWYRDRGYLDQSGVQGTPAASAAAGDLGYSTNGLTGSVALGRAHVRGAYYERTGTAATITHPANTSTTATRVDRVVLRRDLTAKTVVPALVQGTPGGGVPALTQSDTGVWEEPLHQVTVPVNSGTVLTVADDRRWVSAADQLDTGWVNLTPNAGWTVGGDLCGYRVRNGITDVQLHLTRTGAQHNAGGVMLTLPAVARPTRVHWFAGKRFDNTFGETKVAVNGDVSYGLDVVTNSGIVVAFTLVAG